MSEIKLIFIRHGEAENAWGHHADPGLSEKGLSQAKNLINHKNLSNLEDYCFISSPKSRAKETAIPLARKFKKNIVYDETFVEIPSVNVPLNKKQSWLKKILSTKKDALPKNIKSWSDEILNKLININNHAVIFTHFMVMNSVVSNLSESETLLCFYPDYTSILEIVISDKKIKSFSLEDGKKTYINL